MSDKQSVDSLIVCCEQLNLSRLQCYIRLEKAAELPAFTGSTIHGLLGHALKAVDEKLFHLFYGEISAAGESDTPQSKPVSNSCPKPYAVVPHHQYQTQWQAGQVMHFEIKLFGRVAEIGQSVIQALQLGQQMGIGSQRTPYTLLHVTELTPQGERGYTKGISLAERLHSQLQNQTSCNIQSGLHIALQTPLRIKQNGKLLTQLPSLPKWLSQIEQRLTSLIHFWQNDNPNIKKQIAALKPQHLQHYTDDNTFLQQWTRYSRKDQRNLYFDGLSGSVTFHGDIETLLPWFVIAEQLQIGGKSTFGLGQVKVL